MGIIEKGLNPQETPPEDGKYKSAANKALPPDMQKAFDKTVLAGQKLLYSPEMTELIDKTLATDDPIEKKLAEGAVGLVGLLGKRAKPSLPPQVVIPATVELLMEGADFLTESGKIEKPTPEQIKTAVHTAVALILHKQGATPQQIGAMLAGKKPPPSDQAASQAPPTGV